MNAFEKGFKRGEEFSAMIRDLRAAGCDNEDIQNILAEMRDKEQRRKGKKI